LLKAKVDVNIKKKNSFKIKKLNASRDCEMISNAKFKARVKILLNL
jgi:hypothetical protein